MNRVRGILARIVPIVTRIVPAILEQFLFFAGLAAIAFGAWMIYRPLGPIFGGLCGVWISFLISAERK